WSAARGRSHFTAVSFAEMTPRAEDRVVLDPHRRDAWGMPALRIVCRHNETELRLAAQQCAALREVSELLGCACISSTKSPRRRVPPFMNAAPRAWARARALQCSTPTTSA